MTYLQYKIKSWRLPRTLLFSFAGVFVFLSLFTLQEALNPEQVRDDETASFRGAITSVRRTFFKSSLLLTFEIDGYCSEFVCPGFRPFHYRQFKQDFTPGMTVEFAVRRSDKSKMDSCQRSEIIALKSESGAYLTLCEHNSSSYTARRIVAGGVTGALVTAGLVAFLLGLLSSKASHQDNEFWERRTVFRRKRR